MATTNRNRKNILTLNQHHQYHQPQLAQPQHPQHQQQHHHLGYQQQGQQNQQQQQQQHVEAGLPKPFVAAMRTLFDIMDDGKTGFVKLADIEDRWQDDGSKGLPRGVIDSLRKVTPPNGLLSFERFCSGLKICLVRNQSDCSGSPPPPPPPLSRLSKDSEKLPLSPTKLSVRPPSAPLLDLDTPIKLPWTAPNTAAVRPNNAMPAQKTLSMPQLLNPDSDLDMVLESPPIILPGGTYGPPKPPRVSLNLERNNHHQQAPPLQTTSNTNSIDKAEIRNALQNWQMSLLMNQEDKSQTRLTRGPADGQIDLSSGISPSSSMHLYQKKPSSGGGGTLSRRRDGPRRHTLQNGIDYSMLKRLKQIEQEKDILVQGLTAVEKARDWYLKQLASVQDRLKYLGRPGAHMEPWTDAHQERLDLQRARVLEVNRHLMTLAESWERGGFPLHMNLALRPAPTAMTYPNHHRQSTNQAQQPPQPPQRPQGQTANGGQQTTTTTTETTVNRLKQQNFQLSEEINQKNEKLSLLEREKSSLIRELLQLQRVNRASSMTSNTEELVF